MDDRTLIICAATLCLVGVPLSQLPGTQGAGGVEARVTRAGAMTTGSPVIALALPGSVRDAFETRSVLTITR